MQAISETKPNQLKRTFIYSTLGANEIQEELVETPQEIADKISNSLIAIVKKQFAEVDNKAKNEK